MLVRRIEKQSNVLLPRNYPGVCKPVVKAGQVVSETDIIGHCEVSAGQRMIKVAQVLGVSGKMWKSVV